MSSLEVLGRRSSQTASSPAANPKTAATWWLPRTPVGGVQPVLQLNQRRVLRLVVQYSSRAVGSEAVRQKPAAPRPGRSSR